MHNFYDRFCNCIVLQGLPLLSGKSNIAFSDLYIQQNLINAGLFWPELKHNFAHMGPTSKQLVGSVEYAEMWIFQFVSKIWKNDSKKFSKLQGMAIFISFITSNWKLIIWLWYWGNTNQCKWRIPSKKQIQNLWSFQNARFEFPQFLLKWNFLYKQCNYWYHLKPIKLVHC